MAAKNDDTAWEALAALPGPNPCWFHPVLAFLWTGCAGAFVELAGHYPWWAIVAIGVVGSPLVLLFARHRVKGAEPAFEAPRAQAGALGVAAWAVMVGWLAWSTSHSVIAPVSWPTWGVLAFVTLSLGGYYSHLRCTLVEAHEFVTTKEAAAASPTASASTSPDGQAPRPASTELEQLWETILKRAGFGTVQCTITDTWIGYDVHTELDPTRSETFKQVRTLLSKISGVAARELRAHGTPITDTALRIQNIKRDDAVVITVQLRDVLTEKLRWPENDDEPTTINKPMEIGRWASGAPMLLHVPFKHGLVSGRTRSGKSNFAFAVIRRGTQAIDYLPLVLGTDKVHEMVGPLLQPLADGRADRPIIDWVGGEDWEEFSRALRFLWVLCKVRSGAPRGMYRRVDNQIVPANDQPLVHAFIEESDQVLRDMRPIALPGARPQPAGSIIHYLTSKGAGLGICVDLLNQGVTEQEMGPYAGAIKRNIERRVVLNTMKKAHGDWALPDGANVDSSTLHHKDLFGAFETGAEVSHGKACYQDTENEIPAMAVEHSKYVTCLEDYAVEKLRGLIGDDYDNRWSFSRTTALREYFNGQFPYADDVAVAKSPAGDKRGTVTTSSPKGVPTVRDGVRGWLMGTWFVPDISARGQRGGTESPKGTAVSPAAGDSGGDDAGDIPDEWKGLFDEIQSLDTQEPVRPSRSESPVEQHPIPGLLQLLLVRLDGDERDFIPIEELAQLIAMDAGELGSKLTALGVPSLRRGTARTRGRSLKRLRLVAVCYGKGEPLPVAEPDEE